MIPYRLERVLSLRGMREGVRRDCDCLRETLNEAICVGFDVFLEFLEVGHGGGQVEISTWNSHQPRLFGYGLRPSILTPRNRTRLGYASRIPHISFRPSTSAERYALARRCRVCRALNTETRRVHHIVSITASNLKYGWTRGPPYHSR